MLRIVQAFGFLLSIAAAMAGPAAAQDNRPVRLVVSFPPGGGVDAVARLFADKMSALLGQTVVVENRGGASGIIAGKQVASAEPDGTSVLIASNSMVVAQVMSPNVGLDIARDLKALASAAPQAIIITSQPDLPANTLQELIALAKTRRLNYGSPGAGSVPHLLGVSFGLAGRRHARSHPVSRRRAGADQPARQADRSGHGHGVAGSDARRRRQD